MIRKVVRSRGGLHNRVTRRIRLLPFNLCETESYLKSRGVNLDRFQQAQLYMVMGGIPHYLKEIEAGQSAAQNIDRVCFTKDGLLNEEFHNLYGALFEHSERHPRVIRALAKKRMGMVRADILKAAGLTSGGGSTGLIDELVESGFIIPTAPFGRKIKDSVYRLVDEYSLFYLTWIEWPCAHAKPRAQVLSAFDGGSSVSAIAPTRSCASAGVAIDPACRRRLSLWTGESSRPNRG